MLRRTKMSIKESALAKLLKHQEAQELEPRIGHSNTSTASGLPMPKDPKERVEQVLREIGSKYVPQLVDDSKDPPPPMPGYENIHNMQKEDLSQYHTLDNGLTLPTHDETGTPYFGTPESPSSYIHEPNTDNEHEVLSHIVHVPRYTPGAVGPDPMQTLTHVNLGKLNLTVERHREHNFETGKTEDVHYGSNHQKTPFYLNFNRLPTDEQVEARGQEIAIGSGTTAEDMAPSREQGVLRGVSKKQYRAELARMQQFLHHMVRSNPDGVFQNVPIDAKRERQYKRMGMKGEGRALTWTHEDLPPSHKDFMRTRRTPLQKINFGSSIPEESHVFWLPKKPEDEESPFPLAETTAHNHKANHIDPSKVNNAYVLEDAFHLYPFDREFSPEMRASQDVGPYEPRDVAYWSNQDANYWLTEAHKYRDALEDPENAYKLTYRDHIEGHQAIANVNNFMTIPNYGGDEGRGLSSEFIRHRFEKDSRMNPRSAAGREAEKRQSHPGLISIQFPTLWDLLGLQTRHGHADPEWEMAVEKNRGTKRDIDEEKRLTGKPGFYKGDSLHKPDGGEEQRFVLPNSRRSSSRTAQPRWDTGHPEEFLDQLETLLSDAENMEGAIGAHGHFDAVSKYGVSDHSPDNPSKEGLNILERLFPKRTERTEMRSWREAKTIYDQNEELLWEYGIHDLSEYINLSRFLNLVTDLDSRIESANTASYYKIFGRLGEQADPSNPDNWNGGALADLGIQGAISPLIQEAVDYARDTNLRSEGRDSSHTFSKRLGALADFLGFTIESKHGQQEILQKLLMPLEYLSRDSDEEKPITPASFYKGTTDQGLNTGVQFQDAVGNHLSSNPIYVSEETKRRGISLQNPLKGRTLLMPFGTNNEALKTFDDMRKPIIQGAMNFVDQAYEQSPAPGVGKRRMSKAVFEGDYYMKNIHDVRMAQYPFYALDGSVGVTVGKGEEEPVDMQDMDEKGYRMGESRNQ